MKYQLPKVPRRFLSIFDRFNTYSASSTPRNLKAERDAKNQKRTFGAKEFKRKRIRRLMAKASRIRNREA